MQNTTNSFNFDCYVISLKRTPERLATFFEFNDPVKLPIEVFDAVDGSQLDSATIAQMVAPGTVRHTPAIVGVAMSHRALWERCITSGKPHIIFEDDAVIRADAKAKIGALISGTLTWDIILLGYNADAPLELNLAPGNDVNVQFSVPYPSAQHLAHFAKSTNPVGLHRLITAFGICGYAVTPIGARALLNTCFPMDNRIIHMSLGRRSLPSYGIDCLMNVVYRKTHSYACLAPLVMTSVDQTISTIGAR